MNSFLGRVKTGTTLLVVFALFIPIYFTFNPSDVADVMSGAAVVAALSMFVVYWKGVSSAWAEPTSKITQDGALWLLGVTIVAGQNAFNRAFNLWWRTYGHGDPTLYLNFIPAFAGYMALVGYLLQNASSKEQPGWTRVALTGLLGLALGLFFVAIHHTDQSGPHAIEFPRLPVTHPSR